MHLAFLFKDYSPEMKALTFEKKCVLSKNVEHQFWLIIYNSLKEFDFRSQVNSRTRLRKKQALPPHSKKEDMSGAFE